MECKEITIAKLVLGYLKNEKCRTAHKDFFRSSRHLRQYNLNSISRSKYIPTRFVGLTLEDILTEYFDLYQVIQGRLEATNYYNENHSKTSLVDQLLYLLNVINSSRVSTPRSTPCPRSPGDSHLNESSASCIDQISDIETTSVHNLPGNKHFSEEAYQHKVRRRCKENSFNTVNSVENAQNPDVVVNSELLAQTLLENKEFHEKIAQTINKVAEKQCKESAELNDTIRTVVKETEEDPIFDKILDEIIGSAGIVDKELETNSVINQKNSEYDKSKHRPEIRDNMVVQCDSASQTQKTSEVIVFDGSLDKYMVSNVYSVNTQTVPSQNPLYLNSASNLVVIPTSVANVTTTIPTPQQYYLINKPATIPTVSCVVPPAIITEQDILSMPTVIVNDDRPTKFQMPSTSGLTKKKSAPVIKPKGYIEVSSNVDIREFFKNYGPDDPPKTGLKKVIYPKTSAASKQSNNNVNSSIQHSQASNITKESVTVNNTTNLQPAESIKDDLLVISTKNIETTEDSKKNVVTEPTKSVELKEVTDTNTVLQNIPDPNQSVLNTPVPLEILKKTTPKSGSHVRNLDFSTPQKITPQKKLAKEDQNDKKDNSQKKQAVKSLFKQDTDSVAKKPTWDADLRSTIVPDLNTKRECVKRKKKMSPKKLKKKMKIEKKTKVDLNTTDHEAALLEAALKTPIKNEIVDEVSENKEDISLMIAKQKVECNSNSKDVDANKDQEENGESIKSKTILSPSKMNANKRMLVNSTECESNEKNKFITPETINDKNVVPPLKANRNIMPLLETPLKDNIPKTPGVQTPMEISTSPLNNITPFTKMLEANIGYNIDMLPTPSIPITPNFPPFTPNVDLVSPYPNRPTDYSTSSSYYQPSDSEQNKYLENKLLEIEKTSVKVEVEININEVKQQVTSITTAEHLNIFNKNVIGKKNLNLVKRNKHSSSSDSNSNSESSNDDKNDETEDDSFNQETNDTVIFKKKASETPKRVYSLRVRSVTNYKDTGKRVSEPKEIKTPKKNAKPRKKQQKLENKIPTTPTSKKSELDKRKNKLNEETDTDASKMDLSINTSKETSISEKSTNDQPDEFNKEQSVVELKETSELSEKQFTTLVTEQSVDIKSNNKDTNKEPPIQNTSPVKGKCNKKEKLSDKSTVPLRGTKKNETKAKKAMYIKGKLPSSKQSVLDELEEKRKRTISKIKTDTTKKVRNGKFKIKPIPDVSGRKRPRKSDSPKKKCQINTEKITAKDIKMLKQDLDNSEDSDDVALHLNISFSDTEENHKSDNKSIEKSSASDVEAQNLIDGLKERGILLMQNKSQKTKDPRSDDLDESDMLEVSDNNQSVANVSSKNTSFMNSSVEMQYVSKDQFDVQTFDGENEHVIFDENSKSSRTIESFNIEELAKSYIGKLYIEEIDQHIDIPIKWSNFCTLFEFKPESETDHESLQEIDSNQTTNKDVCVKEAQSTTSDLKAVEKKQDDVSGTLQLPKSIKGDHKDKKCEKLLKHLNVDSFLNKMYDSC